MLRRAVTARPSARPSPRPSPRCAPRPAARSFASKAPPESFAQWEKAAAKEIEGAPLSKLTWRTAEVSYDCSTSAHSFCRASM